jgi:alcohol dehydrogenase
LTFNASKTCDIAAEIKERTQGGADIAIDALGSPATCYESISSLRKQGRHIQAGLLLKENSDPPIPMAAVIANELEILGSHGIQAHRYPAIFELIRTHKVRPQKLLGNILSLPEITKLLPIMDQINEPGISVIQF